MLSKKHRLTTALLSEALSKGTIFHGEHFSLRALPAKESRFGVIVPKKMAKTSVERHWYKRRMYNALEPHLDKGLPYHILVSLKKKPIKRENLNFRNEIDTLLNQLIKRAQN